VFLKENNMRKKARKHIPKKLMGGTLFISCRPKKKGKYFSIPKLLLTACVLLYPLLPQTLFPQDHAAPIIRKAPKYLNRDEAKTVKLYEEAIPSVVTVITSQSVRMPTGKRETTAIGSGVLIAPDCHILTAAHVVSGADKIIVKTYNGEQRPAELLFSDSNADIALLKLVAPDPDLPHAELGDSDQLVIGQIVYVIGSPYGLEGSFSIGHISGFRDFGQLYSGTIRAEFIQTDAALNSGNSGGPLFNSQGEVIGIASRILSVSGGFQGLGFVVTINTAKQVLALEDRVWMGIEGIFLDSKMIGLLLNLDLEGGVLIERVVHDSPAAKAGLQGGTLSARIEGRDVMLGGDLILSLGGQDACHSECLVQAHDKIAGMDKIPVKFLRGGKIMETVVDVSNTRRNFLQGDK
jgi:serine protease Do